MFSLQLSVLLAACSPCGHAIDCFYLMDLLELHVNILE